MDIIYFVIPKEVRERERERVFTSRERGVFIIIIIYNNLKGLICRCLCESMDNHNVDTLIAMAGPQNGVWDSAFFDKSQGGEFPLPPAWRNLTSDEVYLLGIFR